ncbi:MAG: hypothetical protein OYH77_04310 [Pseudomonadota bacterium]|nr:hypothetical protein [Pseudomonadota bacterium]
MTIMATTALWLAVSGCLSAPEMTVSSVSEKMSRALVDVLDSIDRRLFAYAGKTISSAASYVKISDAHLDNGVLLGKTVIVQGMVHSRGEQDTFLVLQGDGVRMVVDMTALPLQLLKESQHKHLKILGKLAITGLGFPYIAARSITAVASTPA